MRKILSYGAIGALLVAVCLTGKLVLAGEAPAAVGKDDVLTFTKVGSMAPVPFPHKVHHELVKQNCDVCHGGATPLFAKKFEDVGWKMADLKAGKLCGACHDGQVHEGLNGGNAIFAAKGSCMKCHKKA